MLKRLLGLGAVLGLMPACLETSDTEEAALGQQDTNLIGDFNEATRNGNVDVTDASLVGEIGFVDGLRHYATDVYSYADPYYASFNVTVDLGGDQGAAMTIVSISNLGGEDGYDPTVSVTGCAGDDPGVWSYDAGADEVEYDIVPNADNPKEFDVEYTAQIPDYSQLAYDEYGYPIYDSEIPHRTVQGRIHFVLPEMAPADYPNPYGEGTSADVPMPIVE